MPGERQAHPEGCPLQPLKASSQSRAGGGSPLAHCLVQSMLRTVGPQLWVYHSTPTGQQEVVGGISKLYSPECSHVLEFVCVGVVEPGLCAPLSPEELRSVSDERGGGWLENSMWPFLGEFVSSRSQGRAFAAASRNSSLT